MAWIGYCGNSPSPLSYEMPRSLTGERIDEEGLYVALFVTTKKSENPWVLASTRCVSGIAATDRSCKSKVSNWNCQ